MRQTKWAPRAVWPAWRPSGELAQQFSTIRSWSGLVNEASLIQPDTGNPAPPSRARLGRPLTRVARAQRRAQASAHRPRPGVPPPKNTFGRQFLNRNTDGILGRSASDASWELDLWEPPRVPVSRRRSRLCRHQADFARRQNCHCAPDAGDCLDQSQTRPSPRKRVARAHLFEAREPGSHADRAPLQRGPRRCAQTWRTRPQHGGPAEASDRRASPDQRRRKPPPSRNTGRALQRRRLNLDAPARIPDARCHRARRQNPALLLSRRPDNSRR